MASTINAPHHGQEEALTKLEQMAIDQGKTPTQILEELIVQAHQDDQEARKGLELIQAS